MTQSKPRVLIFSQRNIFSRALFRCPHLEFEDLIAELDSADIVAPKADPSSSRHNIVKRVAYRAPVALNPGIQKVHSKARYDLFLAVCGQPQDLLMANAALKWREVAATSVCLIDEFWISEMVAYRNFLHLLEKFDLVLLYYSQTVKPLAERIKSKCMFLPPGVDALVFNPYPNPVARSVDVYSIGRRSEITHQKLRKMAEEGLFYLHDSIAGGEAIHSHEHRALFAKVAKRTRYFIVNPGLIDRPDIRGDQMEIGNRYFEGAASGTIMVGERPNTPEFERIFHWRDAVIHLPYDSPNIDALIRELDSQPERQEQIRRTNVAESLLHHDWAYRWEAILNAVELQPMPQLARRKERLKQLSQDICPVEEMALEGQDR